MSIWQPDDRAAEWSEDIRVMAEERRRGQPLSQREREEVRRLQRMAAIAAAKKRQDGGQGGAA